jgi:hypothetical protein
VHIDEELVESKISLLRGRGSENNKRILETLALQGPLIKYDIFKALNTTKHYPTISRRVDDLLNRGYINGVGQRTIVVGKRESESTTYGLTWRGLIASLIFESTTENILSVFEKNPHLQLPFPHEITFKIINEIFKKGELQLLIQTFFTGFLRVLPKDLESIEEEYYIMYLIPGFTEIQEEMEDIQLDWGEKDFSKLLDIPGLRELIWTKINEYEKRLSETLEAIREFKKIVKKELIE